LKLEDRGKTINLLIIISQVALLLFVSFFLKQLIVNPFFNYFPFAFSRSCEYGTDPTLVWLYIFLVN
jgi:hypothetical protein